MFGSRRFETKDDSRNSWWVALLTGGEGWHNNHHAHPVSARHGLTWYEFDINYYGIWLLSKIGLAKRVQVARFDPKNPKPAGVLNPPPTQTHTAVSPETAVSFCLPLVLFVINLVCH
jgi:stearoyl-CoA desaturase (delta-9 desaturase)